jgi:hypothetical protein
LAAFSQALSSFAFAPEGSLLSDWMICLHSLVAVLTYAEEPAPVLGVVEVLDVVEVVFVGVEEVLAAVELVLAGVELALLLVEELELLPQAPSNSAQSASTASIGRYRLRFIGPPGVG